MEEKQSIVKNKKKIKKKNLVIIIGILVAFGIIVFAAIKFIPMIYRNFNQEETLKTYLKEMGTEFYENLYYDQIGSNETKKKEFLSKFTEIGIKVNLNSLSRFNLEENKEKIDAFVNKKTKTSCDYENTKAIIYPEEPFGKTNYRIDVHLDCGFE